MFTVMYWSEAHMEYRPLKDYPDSERESEEKRVARHNKRLGFTMYFIM